MSKPWRPYAANFCTVEDQIVFVNFSQCRPTQIDLSEKVSQISSFRDYHFLISVVHLQCELLRIWHSFAPGLYAFQLNELRAITKNFSSNFLPGEGGFGIVHKGYIDEKFRRGLKAQAVAVAVKLLNNDGLQGHYEWLVINFLSFREEIIVTKQMQGKVVLVDWTLVITMNNRNLHYYQCSRKEKWSIYNSYLLYHDATNHIFLDSLFANCRWSSSR